PHALARDPFELLRRRSDELLGSRSAPGAGLAGAAFAAPARTARLAPFGGLGAFGSRGSLGSSGSSGTLGSLAGGRLGRRFVTGFRGCRDDRLGDLVDRGLGGRPLRPLGCRS